MREREERIVHPPDELDGDLQLVQPLGHVVVTSEQRAGIDQRTDGGQVCALESVRRIHLSQVFEIRVVHRCIEV